MEIIVAKNLENFNTLASNIVIDLVKKKPDATLGLATGSTPLGVYEAMIMDHILNGTSYKNIKTFNLDEYVGLDKTNDQSYYYFMQHNLFSSLDIDPANINIPNGMAPDLYAECSRYSNLLKNATIDLQILGIGTNGHIAFNEPGTFFDSETHVTTLTPETIEANSRFFKNIKDVPIQALTMGLGEIMKAKKILLLATGKSKVNAIRNLMSGVVTIEQPASVLKRHPNVTVIVDKEAAGQE